MFTRINNDINGNPRFVVHYLQMADTYERALYLGRKLGGRKFHNKQYGGGIAFQSYNTDQLAEKIKAIKEAEFLAK
jgi:hypothetical protein